jgi:hypothetical protein
MRAAVLMQASGVSEPAAFLPASASSAAMMSSSDGVATGRGVWMDDVPPSQFNMASRGEWRPWTPRIRVLDRIGMDLQYARSCGNQPCHLLGPQAGLIPSSPPMNMV